MSSRPTLGVGIVGFGFIGKVHAHAYRSLSLFYDPAPAKVKLVGVCTSREETAAKAKEQGEFEFATTSFEDLLARDDIHIINVCTPNHLHKEQVIAALEAGKHVYCDKPLTTSLADAREILAVARKHPELTHGMAHQCRFIPATMRARELAAEGFLGEVYHFRTTYYHAGYADPLRPISWRMTTEAGGGALSDLGSHVIDLMRYILGDYDSVRGTKVTFIPERPSAADRSQMLPVEVDDYVCLQARMKQGGIGFIEASRFATGSQDGVSFEIYGQHGAMKFSMMDANWLYVYDARDKGGALGGNRGFKQIECVQQYPTPSALPSPKLPVGWPRFHIHSMFDFVSAVAEGRLGTVTLFDAAATQAVDDAVHRSHESGQWEKVAETMSDE
jgi:predicted dehydrogenase